MENGKWKMEKSLARSHELLGFATSSFDAAPSSGTLQSEVFTVFHLPFSMTESQRTWQSAYE
jgi:hypothetical protein